MDSFLWYGPSWVLACVLVFFLWPFLAPQVCECPLFLLFFLFQFGILIICFIHFCCPCKVFLGTPFVSFFHWISLVCPFFCSSSFACMFFYLSCLRRVHTFAVFMWCMNYVECQQSRPSCFLPHCPSDIYFLGSAFAHLSSGLNLPNDIPSFLLWLDKVAYHQFWF